MKSLIDFTPAGEMMLRFHRGQALAWNCERRIILVLAGTQSGKTSFGPHWLYREIKRRGPGDYIAAAPTFPLMTLKMLPEFLRLFKTTLRLGDYTGSPSRKFTFSREGAERTFGRGTAQETETCVFFGHAQDPDSLESATAKAAWLDEAGQKKFRLESWEAILRRLSIHQGRVLISTTPYTLGWLKQQLWDAWKGGDKDIDVIRFDSTENPVFPKAEFERARRSLPAWKFDMFYRGIFTRPAGIIYDCFDERKHIVPPFRIPASWQRYLGLDFGGVNTAGVFYAEEPKTKRLYLYREYKAGGRTAAEHAAALREGEPMIPLCVGGSRSEGQWRAEFQAAGLPVQEPAIGGPDSVEVGINRVYGAIKRDELFVFSTCLGYLDEKKSYSRVLDGLGNPTEEIEDKSTYHFLDAERYIVGWLRDDSMGAFESPYFKNAQSTIYNAPAGVFLE